MEGFLKAPTPKLPAVIRCGKHACIRAIIMTTLCRPRRRWIMDPFFLPTARRRSDVRFRCGPELVCQVQVEGERPDRRPAKIRNLSAGGMCLILDHKIEPNAVVHLHLQHSTRRFAAQVPLRVIYTVQRLGGDHVVGGVFTRKLSEEERAGLLPGWSPELKVRQVGTATVLDLPYYGLLDDESVRTLSEQLAALVDLSGTEDFVLNCRRIPGLNSALLTQLLNFQKSVKEAGGRLALCAVPPEVSDLLLAANLHEVFRIYSTEEEALRSF
jgi:anti-anti-sigma factor